MSEGSERERGPRRILTWLVAVPVLGAAVAAVGYLVLANLFLNLGGLAWALEGEKDVDASVEQAFSVWPGRVWGRNFHFIVHDPQVEAHLVLKRFELDLELLPLLRKHIRMGPVEGWGVSFHLRKTRPLDELCEQGPGLPSIPGQAEAPDGLEGDCAAQKDTARRPGPKPDPEGLVKLRMDDIRVHELEELWFERHRVELDAELDGAWAFWPTQSTTVAVDRLRIRSARSTGGGVLRYEGLQADLQGYFGPVHFPSLDLEQMWSALTLKGWLKFADGSLEAAREGMMGVRPLAPPTLPRLAGRVTASATVAIEAGHARRLEVHARGLEVAVGWRDVELKGRTSLDVDMVPQEHGMRLRRGRFTLRGPSLRMKGKTERYPETHIQLTAAPGAVFVPSQGRLHAELEARLDRSSLLIDLLPSGPAKVGAEMFVGDDATTEAKARLEVGGRGVDVTLRELKAGDVKVHGHLQLEPKKQGRFEIELGPIAFGHAIEEE